jgi:hypothetical protein
VAYPCRLLDSNRKRNPEPLTRNTRINHPTFAIPNFSQPNQESPPISLQITKLNQVDKHLPEPPVTQVAAICHRACLLKTAGLASPRVGPQIRHSKVGPLPSNMAIPQRCIPCRYKCTSQMLQTRRTREGKNTPQIPTHRTQTITASLPTEKNRFTRYGQRPTIYSQKFWTALAKIFLDEAESRLPSTDNELIVT